MQQKKEDTWQNLAENLADPLFSPFEKPALLLKLAQRAPDISQTFLDVVQGKEEPENILGSRGRQQVRGVRAISRQLTQDILPDVLPEVQRLFDQIGQNQPAPVTNSGGTSLTSTVSKLLDDLTANGQLPSLPSFDDVAGEVKQIFESTPLDLETPAYTLLTCTSDYEIREYSPMTVATLQMSPVRPATSLSSPSPAKNGNDSNEPNPNGNAFQILATFLFGENSQQQAMAMTTPVMTNANEKGATEDMSFVIPAKYGSSATAPRPYAGSRIEIQDIPARKVAVVQFAGYATNQEVVRQRSQLVSALSAAGWVCTNEAAVEAMVLQYNSPFTLPTIRRNEVLVKLDDSWTAPTGVAWSTAQQESATRTYEDSDKVQAMDESKGSKMDEQLSNTEVTSVDVDIM